MPAINEELLRQTDVNLQLNPDLIQDVVDFHEKYGLAYNGPPRKLCEEMQEFRLKFIREEAHEFDTAESDAEALDACCDLMYVVIGYAYLRGWNIAEAWRRVQAANMAKVRAQHAGESKRGTAFDVVKPPGWTAPDHSDLVMASDDENHGQAQEE